MMFREDEEDSDTGKHRFLLCCILNNLHVLSNIMLPVCAHIHFAQYIVSCMKKKRISLNCGKKKRKQVIILLTADCSLIISTGGGATGLCLQRPRESERYSTVVKADLTLVNQML